MKTHETCRYFHPQDNPEHWGGRDFGQCRKYAPKLYNREPDDWPPVYSDDAACGDYRTDPEALLWWALVAAIVSIWAVCGWLSC